MTPEAKSYMEKLSFYAISYGNTAAQGKRID